MTEEYQIVTSHVVNLTVTSNLNSFMTERRFPKNLTIFDLKCRLELLTGGTAAKMTLELLDKHGKHVTTLNNDGALLGSYPADDGMILNVNDNSKPLGEFDDVSQVQKFQLSEEQYAKRDDSVKSFLMKNKLGKYSGTGDNKEDEKRKAESDDERLALSIAVGSRCEVRVTNQPTKRGTVMYVGQPDFKPGWWIGIKYDEPQGKNDGSVDGKRYFECLPAYGGFTKPINVTVGDFPEEDYGLDEL